MKQPGLCPSCGAERLIVVNKREMAEGRTYRRKLCRSCKRRHTFIARTFYAEGAEVTIETIGTSRHQSALLHERLWQRLRTAMML